VKTGQLTTSSRQEKANRIMTSTIFNPYVDPAMVASRTASLKESHGETLDIDSPPTKTVGGRVLRVLNDLLPYQLRPIKSKRRRARAIPNLRHEVYTFRLVWRSHRRPALLKKLQLLKELVWKR
jgi:hypothetical protein